MHPKLSDIYISGQTLTSFVSVYWRVMLYDNTQTSCAWSEAAYFEMAIMQASDWYVMTYAHVCMYVCMQVLVDMYCMYKAEMYCMERCDTAECPCISHVVLSAFQALDELWKHQLGYFPSQGWCHVGNTCY
jgi:hypothetical protein